MAMEEITIALVLVHDSLTFVKVPSSNPTCLTSIRGFQRIEAQVQLNLVMRNALIMSLRPQNCQTSHQGQQLNIILQRWKI